MGRSQSIKRMSRAYELVSEIRELPHTKSSPLQVLKKLIPRLVEYQFLPHYFAGEPKWRYFLRSLNRRQRTLPNYAIIGPIKSCTSAITVQLAQHPSVIAPLSKEFPQHGSNMEKWRPYYPTKKEMAQVEAETGAAITGLHMPYLHRYRMIKKLHEVQPNARIVLMLRDPVKRAYSHWKWDVFLGPKVAKEISYYQDFDEFVDLALDLFPNMPMDYVSGFPFLQSGIYHKSVSVWLDTFGKEQVKVIPAEDYMSNERACLNEIQEFLGITPMDLQSERTVVNENPLSFKPMSDTAKEKLQAFYYPHNQQLFDLLGKEFDWT